MIARWYNNECSAVLYCRSTFHSNNSNKKTGDETRRWRVLYCAVISSSADQKPKFEKSGCGAKNRVRGVVFFRKERVFRGLFATFYYIMFDEEDDSTDMFDVKLSLGNDPVHSSGTTTCNGCLLSARIQLTPA